VPTYQYACTECEHSFEQFQSFSDDALTVCPQCQGRLRKVFNAVGVVFKGSGFYRNDSRSADADGKANGKPVKADQSGSGGESSSGDTGGDKKSTAGEKVAATTGSSAKTSTAKDSPSAA
jgi:putative FmdB family regulatory protein